MNRRTFLAGAALAPIAPLVGCSLSAVTSDIETAVTYVSNIASVVGSVVPALLPSLGLPAATTATVTTDVQTVTEDAREVAGAVSLATLPATSLVQEFTGAASAAIGVVLPLLGATVPEVAVLTAALSLLPSVLSAFGISTASAAVAAVMPAPAANSILENWLATHH